MAFCVAEGRENSWMQILNNRTVGMPRLIVGFLFAPMLPALLLCGIEMYFDASKSQFAAAFFAVVAYLAMLIFGIPGYFLMRKYGLNSLAAYLIFGLVIGAMAYAVVLSFLLCTVAFPGLVFMNSIGMALVGMVFGAIACAAFWLIAIKGNQTTPAD